MKGILRFSFCAFGVFTTIALIIYLCNPNAMPWYVMAIMTAASLTAAFALED